MIIIIHTTLTFIKVELQYYILGIGPLVKGNKTFSLFKKRCIALLKTCNENKRQKN